MNKKEKNGKTNINQKKKAIILVFLFIILTIMILQIILIFSKIGIEIKNLRFQSQSEKHLNNDYEIVIVFYLLGILPIFKLKFNKAKMAKLKKIDLKFLKKNQQFDKKAIKLLKELNIEIKNINLNIEIGTENASLTSILVPSISTVISIILQRKVKKFENQIFKVNPIYINQNLVNIYISGIFELKISHIINIIYKFNKELKKGVKGNERTSNRRSYGYSYE